MGDNMFIDINENYSIDSKEIISILDFQLLNSSEKMRTLIKKNQLNDQLLGEKQEAKSIIITDHAIYYSPFSPISLKRRVNKFSIFNKLENYSIQE